MYAVSDLLDAGRIKNTEGLQLAMNNRLLLREKADLLSDAEVAEVLEYIAIMESLENSGADPLEEIMLRLMTETFRIPTRPTSRTNLGH